MLGCHNWSETIKRSLFLVLAAAIGLAGCQTTASPTKAGDTTSGWSLKKSLPAKFKDYGYRVVSKADGHPVRAGEQSIRFEVRAGDCSWSSGWNDCENDRERHELLSTDAWSGGEEWYHWSIYLPADWPIIYPVKTALGQFHQKGDHPVWMFQNGRGGYQVDNQTTGETTKLTPILLDMDMRGRWSDILIHARWTDKEDGFFRVYVNGETKPRHSWSGPTRKPNRKVYFKFGVYRSFMSRRDGPEPTQIAYFDEVNRAPTCAGATQFFDCGKIGETP